MRTVRINVALIPDARVTKRAKQLSKSVGQARGFFVLDAAHHAHLTLYMSDFPHTALPLVLPLLKKSIHAYPKQILRATALVQKKKSGFVELQYVNTHALGALQKKILTVLNPLRQNISAHTEALRLFSPIEKRNTKKFGYPAVGEEYNPHVTLTRLKRVSALPSVAIREFSFTTATVGVFVVGEHGSAKRRIGGIRLKNASGKRN
jgi:2'-5' RNA ligase